MTDTTTSAPTPVVFIHGLWMHASSWDNWTQLFRSYGYDPVAPGWPGDAATAEECRQNPEPIANRGVAEVTDHYAQIIADLPSAPIVVGHSFGGLIAERLLGMGAARGGVAIAPAQFRGVLRLPFLQLKTAWPVLGHPGNKTKAVSQTAEQFHHGFANGVSRDESDEIHERYAIPAPALPLFQAGSANLSAKSEASVDTHRDRGPLLMIAGGADRTVPHATVHAAFKRYAKNPSITEYKVFPGRSHSQPIDSGWKDVAAFALEFLATNGLAPSASPSRADAIR